MSPSVAQAVKAVVGGIVVLALLLIAMQIFGSYNSAKDAQRIVGKATEAAAPVAPAVSPDFATMTIGPTAPKKVVVVLIDGLNLRAEPLASAMLIRGLSRSEELTLLATGAGWYKVSDKQGQVGWVNANPLYDAVRTKSQ